jgi:UDP-3-O-[3-hydroxymyristoyl] glucosamine N-acyltransferase
VIGRHVQIMPLASIDAECVIGDYATICPSSTIWRRVIVEDGVFVGVGARVEPCKGGPRPESDNRSNRRPEPYPLSNRGHANE